MKALPGPRLQNLVQKVGVFLLSWGGVLEIECADTNVIAEL